MAKRPANAFPPEYYLNRELSWLAFNERVLEEAADPGNPLLERLKFVAIFSSNLDEFFEVRVAGLQQQLYAGLEPQDYPADGLDPEAQLTAIGPRVHALVGEQERILHDEVFPALAAAGITCVPVASLTSEERAYVDGFFRSSVYPVLTPLAIDPGHPFPHVHNKSLNILLLIRNARQEQELFAVVQVPAVLDRLVLLPGPKEHVRFVLLDEVIATHLGELFGGFEVMDHTVFRVTRNTDLTIDEDEAEDLLHTVEETLRQRTRGEAVRLEILASGQERLVQALVEALDLDARDVYRVRGPVDLNALQSLLKLDGFRALRDDPLVPRVPPAFAGADNIFDLLRTQDVLVHHPFESFTPVVDFIERAADDPQVLAIKQTLYRSSGGGPIISALARAAQNGKQVTALVELKARFDEENNIVWARELEEAGVHVVYGVVGLKTHCKAALVVRREADGIRRYVHLSTGNYNPITARIYTDLGLFTAKPEFGEDVSELFNLLTGYSQRSRWKKLTVAPMGFLERVIELIDRERDNAVAGKRSRIIVKMNALVEPSVIDALYRASQAGVPVDLVIRGICCLRSGLPGISDTIRVTSIVDKFLEHSRVFYFENKGDPEVFLASADWMPRNFFRRVEVMFPIEDRAMRARIVDEILATFLSDGVKARVQRPDGHYERVPRLAATTIPGNGPVRAQVVLQNLARESAQAGRASRRRLVPIRRREGTTAEHSGAKGNGAHGSVKRRTRGDRRSARPRRAPTPPDAGSYDS
jgi:polyphosphate kinase